MNPAQSQTQPLPQRLPARAAIVIIGGGIQGLSCAFNLFERGWRDLVVLDAGYWQGGASGRNGTLIRPGFASEAWTELFALSVREWQSWSRRLGAKILYTPRGYSIVAEREQSQAMLEAALVVQRQCGVRSRMLARSEIRRLLPALNALQVCAVQHQPDGGVAPHHAVMKGLLAFCQRHGIEVRYRTQITGLEHSNGRVSAVLVNDRKIAADCVLCCAGPHNPDLARMAGVGLDGFGMRIEAMALEPTRPLIRPAVALIDSLAYFHQTTRGEVVGGTEVPERPRLSLQVDIPVMPRIASTYLRLFPQLANLRILRHWAGQIHVSSDYAPLLGEHPALLGLWFSAGWSYGFAGAPAAGKLLAEAITTGRIDARLRPFALDRFARHAAIAEAAIVLA